jgi:pyruvate/2-oxoglutarate dehydrogenase complex dihydrolipoamide dehydrogenase (E3) component
MARRGHHVTLYEKSHNLGGQWNIAAAQPGKEYYSKFTEYLKRCLSKSGVAIKMGVEITLEKVMEIKPDTLVIATGAVPRALPIPGFKNHNVVQANDVITGKVEPKGKIVVVGGRFIGMEVALALAEHGKKVSIVTLAGMGENGSKLERMIYRTLARRLIELGVPMYAHTPALEITDGHVVISIEKEIFYLPADTVILAVGAQPDNKLAHELEGVLPEVYSIGDCVEPHDAAAAAYQAARLAAKI